MSLLSEALRPSVQFAIFPFLALVIMEVYIEIQLPILDL